jgi:hypothetical protein
VILLASLVPVFASLFKWLCFLPFRKARHFFEVNFPYVDYLDPLPLKHSQATKKLLGLVCYGYKEMLCADRHITTQKQLVKNALSDEWDVIL